MEVYQITHNRKWYYLHLYVCGALYINTIYGGVSSYIKRSLSNLAYGGMCGILYIILIIWRKGDNIE